ncbi:MAG: nitroreductase family protein [Acidobacteriota bacterium]
MGYIYEPAAHALGRLKLPNNEVLSQFVDLVNQILLLENSTIIWFAAQFDRTLSKYEDGESLVWRDCGALIATISLVAECLGLNCCAVGITGEPLISQMLSSEERVVGVGGLLLGSANN